MSGDQIAYVTATATAEVTKADPERVAACVAQHPGLPCPGWPHDTAQEG